GGNRERSVLRAPRPGEERATERLLELTERAPERVESGEAHRADLDGEGGIVVSDEGGGTGRGLDPHGERRRGLRARGGRDEGGDDDRGGQGESVQGSRHDAIPFLLVPSSGGWSSREPHGSIGEGGRSIRLSGFRRRGSSSSPAWRKVNRRAFVSGI